MTGSEMPPPTSLRGKPPTTSLVSASSQARPCSSAATTYQRRESHKPRTTTNSNDEEEEEYYVLTLATDPAHHDAMSDLRKRYFPPALLKVPAHITLFHALPGSQLPRITSDIRSVMTNAAVPSQAQDGQQGQQPQGFPICAQTQTPFRMARGVGVGVTGLRPAERWFEELQARWRGFLSQQDRGRFRGHYTVMNKVDDEQVVLRCLGELEGSGERGSKGRSGVVCGMALWRYDRGWWRHYETFTFSENADSS